MARGNLVLCKKTNHGQGRWTDRIIAWVTKGQFVHVEVDVGDGRWIGAHLDGISEGTAGSGDEYVYVDIQASDAAIDAGIAFLKTLATKKPRYGWLDIISDGLKFLGFPFFIAKAGHYDCSDLATRYLIVCHADAPLGDLATEPHVVTPNDIARAFHVPV